MKKLFFIVTGIMVVTLNSVRAQEFTFSQKWIKSRNVGNFAVIGTEARCMAYYNDTLYFSDRAVNINKMRLYSAETGEFSRAFVMDEITDNLGNNTIRTDAAGNIILANLTTDARTSPLHIWGMANASDAPILIVNYLEPTAPKALRVDYINVYGNIYGNGYIMAAITGTGTQDQDKTVLKWNINGGIVSSNPEKIILSGHYPTSTTSNGNTPHVFPIDATTFYFDGASSYPTLYSINGTLLDGFANAGSTTTPSTAANGVATVKLGDRYFMICGASSVTNSFYLYEMGEGGTFTDMTLLSEFPEGGLGTALNDRNVVLPIIEKVNESQANIYVYAFNNGYAKYELKEKNPTTAEKETQKADYHFTQKAGIIYLSEKSNVEIYNIFGQKMIGLRGVCSIIAPTIAGHYIVKAMNKDGISITKKVHIY